MGQGGTMGAFSVSTPGWVCFVLSQWGEFEWSMRTRTALVPCTQSQPQNHILRTKGCVAASSGYLRSLSWSIFTAVYCSVCFVEWCTTSKESECFVGKNRNKQTKKTTKQKTPAFQNTLCSTYMVHNIINHGSKTPFPLLYFKLNTGYLPNRKIV